jgi:multidrug efflux pump subunit AcrB
VLVGLAAKNAILIVEFAKQAEEQGMSRFDAAVAAARTRLRPIVMTSLAFILGVLPLAVAVGAGAEMRQDATVTEPAVPRNDFNDPAWRSWRRVIASSMMTG